MLMRYVKGSIVGITTYLVILILLLAADGAFAANAAVAEVERDTVDVLMEIIVYLAVALGGGGVLKGAQVYHHRRNGAHRGVQEPSGLVDAGKLAIEAQRAHEIACDERYGRIEDNFVRVHQRLDDQAKADTAMQSDLSFIRGVLSKGQPT